MPLQIFGACPWCGARLDLRRIDKTYTCPVCSCTFERNFSRWKIGIPVAVGVLTLLWVFVPRYGLLAAGLGAIAVLIVTAKAARHRIVSRGRSDISAGEAGRHQARLRESRWFTLIVVLLLLPLVVLLVLALARLAGH
jgi:hypothetical protein